MAYAQAAIAVAGLVTSIVQGQRQATTQKHALKDQQTAQNDAAATAAAQSRRSQMEQAKANARQPDVPSLLSTEQQKALAGSSSTTLTGPAANARLLGGKSLLGS